MAEKKSEPAFVEVWEIPQIELYMDQVTTFMESKLAYYRRNDEEKILTKTMINNYAKEKLFPSPVKKKYGKNHIMLLIMIYHLKSMLSIADIKRLLAPINESLERGEEEPLNSLYDSFVLIEKKIAAGEDDASFKKSFEGKVLAEDDRKDRILEVLMLSLYVEKAAAKAERIIAESF